MQTSARIVAWEVKPTPFGPCERGIHRDKTRPQAGGHPYERRDVKLFQAWLRQTYGDECVPVYKIAADLGIHRECAGEWVMALSHAGMANWGLCQRGNYTLTLVGAKPFTSVDGGIDGTIEPRPIPYDPWTDRSWDTSFVDPWFPYFVDETIDDHYSAYVDEVMIYTGRRRVRADGHYFLPLDDMRDPYDHPIYWYAITPEEQAKSLPIPKRVKGAGRYFQANGRPKAPPQDRKGDIEAQATGGRPGLRLSRARPEEAAEKGDIQSWIDGDFLRTCEDCDKGVRYRLEAPRGGRKPGGGKKRNAADGHADGAKAARPRKRPGKGVKPRRAASDAAV